MAVFVVPLPTKNVEAWKAFMGELNGPRKADFADFNRRHGLTKHQAWHQPTPAGSLIIVVQEGPGFPGALATARDSDHPFDRYFIETVSKLHEIDIGAGGPPEVELVLDASAPPISA